MTAFLPETSPDQVAPLAEQPATGFWDRVTAAGKKAWIEADVWNRARVISDSYEGEIRDSLPTDPANPPSARDRLVHDRLSPETRRRAMFDVIKALKISEPEKYADTPTSEEEFQAQVLKRRRAEYDEQISILDNAPGDAFAAQTIGELWAGFSDPLSIATLPLGGPEAKSAIGLLKSLGIEAGVAGVTELAQDPQRQQVAADLDLPAPDTLENILMGAAGAAGLVGGIHGIAKGVGLVRTAADRFAAYRAGRGEAAAAARPADLSPGQHEARIDTSADALTKDKTPPATPEGLPPITPDAPPNWQAIRGGIFAGESGGDFNALFGFSNREGGPWSHIKLTEMTVDEAIAFSDPRGEYARWVRARVGRTATPMGAYQIVGTTLREAKKLMGLRGDELMDEAMQERLGQFIYRRQGTGAWEGYRGPRADFEPGNGGSYSGGQSFEPTRRGYTGEGQVTAGDRRIDVEYVVVDASKLQKASGRFQPRDRSRLNSDAWIAETAARLDPAQLMPSPTADRGAPIVGPDMMVESGNGRFSAIQRAYAMHPDRAAAYRQQIEAAGFAIPEGVKEPVLVARRKTALTDAEREQFAVDAQDSGVARMTPTEIARTSARAMTAERLASFQPGTAIGDAANRPFLQSVLGDLPRSERNALFDESGALNAEGKRRVAHAFFARAWDDGSPLGRDVLARYAEAEDAGELKSLMDALDEAAPSWATLRAEIEAGAVRPEFDITPHVLDALRVIMQARREASRAGGSIADAIDAILDQGDLFIGPNPLSVALLRKFWRDGRAAPSAEIARFLTRYADEARTVGRTGDMLGASPADALRAIDQKAFADLPDDIPPIEAAAPPPLNDPALPETAFADGADSPEAQAADQVAMDDLRGGADIRGQLDQMATEDPAYTAALARQSEVQPTTELDGYGTDAFWQQRKYQAADGKELLGRDAAVDYLKDKARSLAWSDEGLPPGNIRSERMATIVIGPPAAGKSTVANPLARDRGAVIVDADEAKKVVPEFGKGDGASAVHEESSELASRVLEDVLVAGDNVLLPKVGSSAASIERTIAALRLEGYRVELIEVSTRPEEAIARMIGRGRATGRFIPPEIMAAGIDGAPRTYQTLKEQNLADAYARIENTPGLGQPRGVLEDPQGILGAFQRRDGGDRPAPGERAVRSAEGPARSPRQDQAGITPPNSIGRPGAEDELSAAIAAARAEFEDLGDFELPDGTRAFDILDDLDSDQTLLDVLDACLIGGSRP